MPIPAITKTANSSGASSSLVVSGARLLKAVVGFSNKGSDQYVQIFDAAALPADGAVPLLVIRAVAGYPFSFDYPNGRPFENGIVVCNSSTVFTKTIALADCNFDLSYE